MPAEIIWRPRALEDLLDIYITIALDSEAVAERVFSTIEARALTLADFPHLGSRRPEIAPTARILVEGSYLLLYELHPDADDLPVYQVEIVRIVDGRRELTGLF